ncbi:membrane-anchored ubiquitin-fold protein 3 isoform X1 [Beta vulgaris subsp. vulgaris]|uniref:membrane-anchored ubiquitin-fold protein 3 isoform X1 n=1 Tax=Beta vulgaris subsp. vulgaris TaxID=3555 RepID=UPI00203669D0|nr:membrane-anchored ubiquitin-fold protein 3 isoform X1 [Beta vulgaris subsp. vulgaris]
MTGRISGPSVIHRVQLLPNLKKELLLSGPKAMGLNGRRVWMFLSSSLNKKVSPKAANDIKIISGGRILENSKNVGQCRIPFGELQKAVITMHVVVQPSVAKSKTEKKIDDSQRKGICSCSIL